MSGTQDHTVGYKDVMGSENRGIGGDGAVFDVNLFSREAKEGEKERARK